MSDDLILAAHRLFQAALGGLPADPTAQQPHEAPMTTTRHRPRCTRPGWQVEDSRTIRGCQIARCIDCEAIELRTPTTTTADPYKGETR